MTQKNNEYKTIMEHVQIPNDVWNQTTACMENAKHMKSTMVWKKAVAVCAIIFICGISVIAVQQFQKDKGPVFLSAMKDDSEYAYVELEEGSLTFDVTRELSELQVQTGSLQGTKEKISWDELEALIKTKVNVSPLPSGFTKTKEEAVRMRSTDGKTELLGTLEYEKDEAYIHLQVEQGNETGKQNSQINGIGLYTAMEKNGLADKSREYLAQFCKNGNIYTLQTSGLPQKEFIKIVYFLTK